MYIYVSFIFPTGGMDVLTPFLILLFNLVFLVRVGLFVLEINMYPQDPTHHVVNFSKELFFILLSYLLFY